MDGAAKVDAESEMNEAAEFDEAAEVDAVTAMDADPDAWIENVELSALECVHEGTELPAPSFPFVQSWHRQHGGNGGNTRGKKRKRQSKESYWNEAEHEGDTSYLPYDDEDVHIASSQLDEPRNALPPVPENLELLPVLPMSSMRLGDVIVFKQFEVSAATGWRPAMSDIKTATVEVSDGKDALVLRLAERHWPVKEYDEQGKRIYGKFEQAMGEDDDFDPVLEVEYSTLKHPALLFRPQLSATETSRDTPSAGTNGGENDGIVPESINPALLPYAPSDDEAPEEMPSKKKRAIEERPSQTTSIESNAVTGLDQAAQVRASMLTHDLPVGLEAPEETDTSFDISTSRGSQTQIAAPT